MNGSNTDVDDVVADANNDIVQDDRDFEVLFDIFLSSDLR